MKLQREKVAALLKQQAPLLNVKVVQEGGDATFQLEIDEKQYYACCLSSSSDYYYQRLNLNHEHITMLVVNEHLTCTPIPVLALDEGYFYAPAEFPRWYDPEVRRHRNSMVVIGGMLSGVQEAYTQVNDMKSYKRYRYLARMDEFLSNRQGRILAV
jgi:hypothetical protein